MNGSMRSFLLFALLLPTAAGAKPALESALYFSIEVRRAGHVVAKPQLLGEAGKTLRVERRPPGAAVPDYQLVLSPTQVGQRYQIALDLALPQIRTHSELALMHGQVGHLQLGARPGDLELSVTLMKVDSPEFRALMDLANDAPPPAPSARSI